MNDDVRLYRVVEGSNEFLVGPETIKIPPGNYTPEELGRELAKQTTAIELIRPEAILEVGDGGDPEKFTTIAEVKSITGEPYPTPAAGSTEHMLRSLEHSTFDLNFQPRQYEGTIELDSGDPMIGVTTYRVTMTKTDEGFLIRVLERIVPKGILNSELEEEDGTD